MFIGESYSGYYEIELLDYRLVHHRSEISYCVSLECPRFHRLQNFVLRKARVPRGVNRIQPV